MSVGIIASQAFSPNKIADLNVDLDGSDLGTLTESGGALSIWFAKSRTNGVGQFGGSQQPLIGLNTINGKNVVTFDGDDDFMEVGSFAVSANMTIFIAFKIISTGNQFQSLLALDATNDFQIDSGVDGEFRARFRGSNLGDTSPPLHPSDLVGIPSIINYRLSANDSNVVLRVNGVQSDTDTYNGGLSLNPTLYLGRNRSGSFPLNVDIGQVVIYDRDLTLPEMVEVETYMSNRWGIALL